jgi:hypothetical protein
MIKEKLTKEKIENLQSGDTVQFADYKFAVELHDRSMEYTDGTELSFDAVVLDVPIKSEEANEVLKNLVDWLRANEVIRDWDLNYSCTRDDIPKIEFTATAFAESYEQENQQIDCEDLEEAIEKIKVSDELVTLKKDILRQLIQKAEKNLDNEN